MWKLSLISSCVYFWFAYFNLHKNDKKSDLSFKLRSWRSLLLRTTIGNSAIVRIGAATASQSLYSDCALSFRLGAVLLHTWVVNWRTHPISEEGYSKARGGWESRTITGAKRNYRAFQQSIDFICCAGEN